MNATSAFFKHGTRHLKSLIFCVTAVCSGSVFAQEDVMGTEIPDSIKDHPAVREANVNSKVPVALRRQKIRNLTDLRNQRAEIRRATNRKSIETIRFRESGPNVYHGDLYVHGIRVKGRSISIEVDPQTKKIKKFRAPSVRFGFEQQEALLEGAAFALLKEHLADNASFRVGNESRGEKVYVIDPQQTDEETKYRIWWKFWVPRSEKLDIGAPFDTHDYFYVSPEGKVESAVRSRHAATARVCDGTVPGASTACIYATTPLVIDTNGNCQPGYSCGSSTIYRRAYDTALETVEMIEDVRGAPGCCDIGDNNTILGGNIDIQVVSPGEAGGSASYSSHETASLATLRIEEDVFDVEGVTSHEVGHGYHELKNPGSYWNVNGNAVELDEADAVIEFVGEAVGTIKKNYNGPGANPKFDANPDWVTVTGYDYEQQFDHSQMTGANPYADARVGGHALYELAQAVGLQAAAKVFLDSIENIDTNDEAVAFEDIREAMVNSTTNATIKAAIEAAWDDVGVSAPAGGGSGGGSSGAPAKPTGGVAVPIACPYGVTITSATWNSVSGASHYDLRVTGGGITNYATVTENNDLIYHTVSGTLYVSACNIINQCSSELAIPVNTAIYCGFW